MRPVDYLNAKSSKLIKNELMHKDEPSVSSAVVM